ncbi:MAG: helix-turn-helix domain-containing protein, partial [Geodermatophilaceae bacterium]
MTLGGLSEATAISVSTLSRLESGHRRPSLELLLPLARTYRVPLDELVGAPPTGDPRVHLKPRTLHGMTVLPLTQQPGPLQAYKMVLPPGPTKKE